MRPSRLALAVLLAFGLFTTGAAWAAPDALDAGPTVAVVDTEPDVPAAKVAPDSVLTDGRESGGIWIGLLLAFVAAGRSYRARTMPKPGQPEPDPRSWRAKSIAIAGALVVVTAAVADALIGIGGWWAVIAAVGTSAAMVWSALDPPKGSKLAKAVEQPIVTL